MGRALSYSVGLKPGKFIVVFIMLSFVFATITIAAPSSEPPGLESELPAPEPNVWVEDEFIISYDDAGFQDASNPVIAVSPSVPTNPMWGNSIHAAWTEFDEIEELYTIHYSMSIPEDKGLEWSNDEATEGDRTISGLFGGKNASNPSMIIDDMGFIHIVWCQEYFEAGFTTYEVHYSQSMDNGLTWSPEVLVSNLNGGLDAPMEFFPKIEVSNDYIGQKILHVIWSEYTQDYSHSEMFYSTSTDGINWSGTNEDSPIRTDLTISAYDPDITVGGGIDQFVHITWSQESLISGTSEVYYIRSQDAGTGGIWDEEKVISNDQTGPGNLWVGLPKIATVGNNVYTIWDQPMATDGNSEICISFSNADGANDWSSINADNTISFEDTSAADWGSLDLITDPNGAAYAIWTEFDESSPDGSTEIHFSMSPTPDVPASWTGRQKDIILSYPDGEDGIAADALYPSVDIANFGGGWEPQIIWSELNAQGVARAGRNTEIHYLPDTTYDVPIHLGWNLISCPLIQNDTSILNVLNDSAGDGNTTWDMVRGYTNNGTVTTWTSYFTAKPSSLNDLWNIDHKMGIWINITSLGDGNLTFSGDYGNSTSIDLKVGWNLVGYPAQTSKSITDALGSINDRPVEGYNGSASYLIVQLPGTYMMQPGEGYWIHVASDTTWTVDW